MKIYTITAAVLINESRVLLLKRKKDPYKEWWAFPGGKVEFSEDIVTAMKREIVEETGIHVSNLQFIATINERVVYTDSVESQFTIFYWQSKITKQQVSFPETKDTREGKLRWFNLNNAPFADIVPSDRIILKNSIKGKEHAKLYECVLQRIPAQERDDLILQKWNAV